MTDPALAFAAGCLVGFVVGACAVFQGVLLAFEIRTQRKRLGERP